MRQVATRVALGVLAGLRVLWVAWLALWVVVAGGELAIGVPVAQVALVTVAFAALPLALMTHELGHACAAVAVGARGLRLSRQGWAIEVSCVCATPRDDAVVAFGGPFLCAAGGVVLVALEHVTHRGLLVVPAVLFLAGALSLGPWARDGRTFWLWAWSTHAARRA